MLQRVERKRKVKRKNTGNQKNYYEVYESGWAKLCHSKKETLKSQRLSPPSLIHDRLSSAILKLHVLEDLASKVTGAGGKLAWRNHFYF